MIVPLLLFCTLRFEYLQSPYEWGTESLGAPLSNGAVEAKAWSLALTFVYESKIANKWRVRRVLIYMTSCIVGNHWDWTISIAYSSRSHAVQVQLMLIIKRHQSTHLKKGDNDVQYINSSCSQTPPINCISRALKSTDLADRRLTCLSYMYREANV